MRRYRDSLAQSNAADFDDLLSLTVTLLQESEAARCALSRRFHHILVDEFQVRGWELAVGRSEAMGLPGSPSCLSRFFSTTPPCQAQLSAPLCARTPMPLSMSWSSFWRPWTPCRRYGLEGMGLVIVG